MKRILCLLAVLALCVSALFACSDDEGGITDGGKKEPVDYGSATVFEPGDTVQIIAPHVEGREFATYLSFHLRSVISNNGIGDIVIGSEYSPNAAREICIGLKDESRPATLSAYKYLERLPRDSYFEMRYAIYASGGVLAIAYDRNEYTNLQILDVIEDDFINKYIKDKSYVAFGEGLVASGTIDLVLEQEELDVIQLQEEWAALESKIGKEATDAFRKLYTLYGDDMAEWAANLYDPGVGGFYSNNSGRDGVEFGPDVECTVQIMRFFVQSGMTKNISTDWTVILPEYMQQQMIYFTKSLQNSNGYFYHPQWGTDIGLSRRGRDLGWATTLLTELDSKPPYKAANGKTGDGITADEYWDSLVANGEALGPRPYPCTESPVYSQGQITKPVKLTSSLGGADVSLVSNIVLTADDNPDDPIVDTATDYLKSYTSFINWLLTTMGPGFDSNPYSMGNTMNATQGQIANSSTTLESGGKYSYTPGDELTCTNFVTALKQVKVNTDSDSSNDLDIAGIYKLFEGMNLKEMTHFMLVEKINPEIGLWGQTSAKNPTGTEFLFTNGYFKTIGLFSGWGYAYPAEYIPKAANALMQGLLGDQPSTTNICEVYNIWSAIGSLKGNLKYLNSTDYAYDDAGNVITDKSGNPVLLKTYITNQVNTILQDNLAEAIENSYNKIKGYKKIDGGFDHAYVRTEGGYSTQQGCYTGYRLNNQSNVDATCIGSTGLTRTMFDAIGLSSYKVSLHTESDWMKALEIFIALDPVIKYSYDEESASAEVHDYEADIPGSGYLKMTMGSAGNTFTQTKIGENGVGVLNKTDNGYQAYLDWKPNSVSTVANSASFETKVMFSDIVNANDRIELRLYNGTTASGTRIYSLYFTVNVKTGIVSIAPKTASSQKVDIGKIGEWINISLVYFEQTVVDGKTISACFKVYVNGSQTPVIVDPMFEDGSAVAASSVGFSRFITMKSFLGKIYLDDTRFAREQRDIVEDKPTHNAGANDVDEDLGLPNNDKGCTVLSKDGVLTFDNVTAFPIKYDNGFVISNSSQSAWKGYISAEKEDGKSFIRINDLFKDSGVGVVVDSGQPILLIDRPDYTGSDDTFVFEAKFRVTSLKSGELKNDNSYYIDLTFRNSAEKRVYRTYFGNKSIALNSDTKNEIKGVYTEGEWFTLKVEYTVIGTDADTATWDVKAYINGTLVQENSDKTVNDFASSRSVDKVGILLSKGFQGNFDIADIKIYQQPYVNK